MEKLQNKKPTLTKILIISIFTSAFIGGLAGFFVSYGFFHQKNNLLKTGSGETFEQKIIKIDEESAVISIVGKTSPAVVSIIATKDLPKVEHYYYNPFYNDPFFREFFGEDFGPGIPGQRQVPGETEKREISNGTGFIISDNGYILTNKHVVAYDDVEYTILMNNEKTYNAEILARDPINDIAILKIEAENLPHIELGDSDNLKIGQTVVAIGNALGEFKNTVSTGVISGLSRSLTATSFTGTEQLINVIQTDASINPGNSGGPLLNISGQVIGINTAIIRGAQNIGFAIPINEAKTLVKSIKEHGRIIRPWLGIRYIQINKTIAEANNLKFDYGVLIIRGENISDLAVIPGSPADKAGLIENDIILEINGEKITGQNPLNRMIAKFQPGEEITLKLIHKGEEKEIKITLAELE
jgi:serine protease Do